ncbi:MAG: galactose oxidase [Reichenbachiella sp.]
MVKVSKYNNFEHPVLWGNGLLGIGIFFLIILSNHPIQAQEKPFEGFTWKNVEAKGEVVGRHENAFVKFQDKFYLIGGRGINPVNVFDPKTNQWETKGKTPLEIHHFQPVVYNDAIYFVGAMTGKYPVETPLENIWMYYPKKDKWEKGPNIPKEIQRGGAGVVIRNDKIYVACGIDLGHTSGTNNSFDSFDLKTSTWTRLTKAPHIRDHFSAVLVNDKLYLIGGRNTSEHHEDNFAAFFGATTPEVDVYDFSSEKWITLKAPLSVPTAAGSVVNVGQYILYAGGESNQPKAHNQTQCLDTKTGDWIELATLNIGRHGSHAIVHEGNVYIAAGSPNRGGGNMGSIEVFSK